jgi:molecular chaperone GrpE
MSYFDRRWGLPIRGARRVPIRRPIQSLDDALAQAHAAAEAARARQAANARQAPQPVAHPVMGARQAPREPRAWPQPGPVAPTVAAPAAAQAPVPVPVVVTVPASDAPPAESARSDEVAALQQEIARLNARLEEKELQAHAQTAPAHTGVDEIERTKERLRKDAAREIEQHKRDLVADFIEVLDDLDRAVHTTRDSNDAAAVLEGVELVRKRFRGKLAQHGVALDPSLGKGFDPARHEAVSTIPVRDPGADGMVVAVVREGYRIGDDVLRPAQVVVAKAS